MKIFLQTNNFAKILSGKSEQKTRFWGVPRKSDPGRPDSRPPLPPGGGIFGVFFEMPPRLKDNTNGGGREGGWILTPKYPLPKSPHSSIY